MAQNILGNAELKITPIGMGTWAIGGDWALGWGPQDDSDSIAAIRRGVDAGINWIDTAPIYGFGHAEQIVGKALKDLGGKNRPFIFTKCGLVWDDEKNIAHSLKVDSIKKEVESSLQRMQVDVLDLCQIHWPSFPPGSPDPDLEQAWSTLSDLVAQGKIRYIGVSNFSVSQIKRVQKIAPVTSLQPPYSMLMRQVEKEVLPFCEDQGIGVIGYSPLHNGLLSGKMTRERIEALPASDWRANVNPAFREPHLSHNLALVELLRNIGDRHGKSVAHIAIAWALRLSAVTGSIVGSRNAGQIDGVIDSMDFRLSISEISEIEAQLPESLDMMQLS